jgi:hypothetical protein
LLEEDLSFRQGFGQIVEPETFLYLLPFSFQVRVKTVVDFPG